MSYVETTPCYAPRYIASRQHLPGTKGKAGASPEGLLESIGCLHGVQAVAHNWLLTIDLWI